MPLSDQESAEVVEAIKQADPGFHALLVEMYQAGMIDGRRALVSAEVGGKTYGEREDEDLVEIRPAEPRKVHVRRKSYAADVGRAWRRVQVPTPQGRCVGLHCAHCKTAVAGEIPPPEHDCLEVSGKLLVPNSSLGTASGG